MIKNERQYRITKAQLELFEQAVARLTTVFGDEGVHPRIRQAQLEAARAQANELRTELAEYDSLKSGAQPLVEWRGLDRLGELLIKARIAMGLTQRQLADRLDLKEQQIQRYEATSYGGASLTRLATVADALGIDLHGALSMPVPSPSFSELVTRLKKVGFDHDFINRRLSPARSISPASLGEHPDAASVRLAGNVRRIYGWETGALLSSNEFAVDPRAVAEARFKLPARVNEPRLAAYTVYAHYLALVVLKATSPLPQPVPRDAVQVRLEIVTRYGDLTFASALRYVWSLGIPVLPLSDPGVFHGAIWRSDGRSVIVLKQRVRSEARWLFDLLHELHHASDPASSESHLIIETEQSPKDRRNAPSEWMASEFAGDVLLDGRAQQIAEACADEAHGSIERLKSVVPKIASREGVRADVLANYLAYRIGRESGRNWWGAAVNLQSEGPDPWAISRDMLLSQIDPTKVPDDDQALLKLALSEL